MIGSVKFQERLYILNDINKSDKSVNSVTGSVWHKRLGHLSDKIFRML